MFRVYRCIILAIAGLAIFAASPSQYGHAKQPSVPETTVDAKRQPPALPLSKTAKDSEKPCNEGQDNRSSDLCAQWKAADAAAHAADAAWFFGCLGAGIGLLTLIAAISAAVFARNAAIETKTANQIAGNTATHQLRPYVGPEGVYINGPGETQDRFTIGFKNFGQTPALSVTLTTQIAFGREPKFAGDFNEIEWGKPEVKPPIHLPPGQFFHNSTPFSKTELGCLAACISGASNLMPYLRAKITHDDIFGVRRSFYLIATCEQWQIAGKVIGIGFQSNETEDQMAKPD